MSILSLASAAAKAATIVKPLMKGAFPNSKKKEVKTPSELSGVGTTAQTYAEATRPQNIQDVQDVEAVVWSTIESKVASEKFWETFWEIGWWIDALGYRKLSREKAIKDVKDFSNPSSTKAKAFIANLWEEKYKFAKYIDWIKNIANERANVAWTQWEFWNTQDAFLTRLVEWTVTDVTRKTVDYLFWTNLKEKQEQEEYAIEFNVASWKEDTYPIASTIGWIVGDLPKYAAMSYIGWPLAIEAWLASRSPTIIKYATNLDRIAKNSPTLYAATVDNAVVTTMDYGMKSVTWDKNLNFSWFLSDLFIGAAFPVGLKWIWEWLSFTKWILPKDIFKLDKAVSKEIELNGATNAAAAIDNISESFKFEDGKTLWEKVNEYKTNISIRNNNTNYEYDTTGTEYMAIRELAPDEAEYIWLLIDKWVEKWTEDNVLIPKILNAIETRLWRRLSTLESEHIWKLIKYKKQWWDNLVYSINNNKPEVKSEYVNPDATISPEEVISSLAKENVVVTTRWGKKIANALSELNSKLSDKEEVLWAYGEMGSNDNIQLAKQEIVSWIRGKGVVNWEEADKVIDEVLNKYSIDKTWIKVADDIVDELDEVLHNPNSSPEKIQEATNMDELTQAIEWDEKVIAKKEIDAMRFENGTNQLDVTKLTTSAEMYWIKVNLDKLYIKEKAWVLLAVKPEPKINKDYVTSVLDEIEVKRTWYSKTRSTILREWRNEINRIKWSLVSLMEWITWKKYKSKFLKWKWWYTWDNADEFIPDDMRILLRWEAYSDSITFWELTQRDFNKLIYSSDFSKLWDEDTIVNLLKKSGDINKLRWQDIEDILKHALSDTKIKWSIVEKQIRKFLPQLTTINREMAEIATRIKNAATVNERAKLTKLREKKNLQIKSIKEKFWERLDAKNNKISELRTKAKEVINFSRYVRDSIDLVAWRYSRLYTMKKTSARWIVKAKVTWILKWEAPKIRLQDEEVLWAIISPSEMSRIKDKYKAKLRPNTTVDWAIKIMEDFDKELHIKSFNLIEKEADSLIWMVLKAAKSKSKNALVDFSTIEKLIELNKMFNDARPKYNKKWELVKEWDLERMVSINREIHNFYKTWRDAFKANKVATNVRTKSVVSSAIDFLNAQGQKRFEVRFGNTPNSWTKKSSLPSVIAESFGSNLVINRMFRGFKPLVDIFYWAHEKTINEFVKLKAKIKDTVAVNILEDATKNIGYWKDDASVKLTLWFRSKSNKWNPWNMRSNFIMEKTKNWDYKVRFERDPQAFREANMDKFDSWDYVHFGTSNDDALKESILNKIYSQLESQYNSSPSFKANVDELNAHFSKTWDWIAEKGKRLFNKIDFVKDEKYFPFFKQDMGDLESAFDTQWNFSTLTKKTLNDWMLNERVDIDPNELINTELGFIENVTWHLDTNVWWEMNIENLLEADRMIRWLKKWRNGSLDDVPQRTLDEAIDLAKLSDEVGEFTNWKYDALDNPILSPEALTFLRRYTAMVATRGRSETSWNWISRLISRVVGYDNMAILSSPFTVEAQLMSAPLIPFHSWVKNTVSAERSVLFNQKNVLFAIDQSWILMERQRMKFSKEGVGNQSFITSDETFGNTISRNVAKWFTFVTDHTVKMVDWAVSVHAWFAWVSKYLDENAIAWHKAWAKFDLQEVYDKVMKMDNWKEVWKDIIAAGNDWMTRTMGSNQLTDKSVNANDSLFKIATLFQKTGLNTMVSSFDKILESWEFAKLRWENPKLARTVQAARWTIASLAVGALALQRDNDRRNFREWIWVAEPLDMDAPENSLAWRYVKAYINGNFIWPKDTLDLLTWIRPVIKDFARVWTSETVWMATQELTSWLAKFAMNAYYVDFLRFAVSKTWVGVRTKIDADKYNSVVKSLKEEYEKVWKDFSKEKNFDEIVQKRLDMNEARSRINKEEKPFKDAEAKLIKDSLSKYNWKPSFEQFMKEYNSNKWNLKPLEKASDIKNLYKKTLLEWAKTNWQRDSVLSWMSSEMIFEVELKPLIDSWKAWTAKKRWQEMVDNKVFKTPQWAMDMYKKMVIYNKSK